MGLSRRRVMANSSSREILIVRMLLASPIGATRRVLENWMVSQGHKVLTADSFDSASRQVLANPTLEMVITEWLLGGNTAYDLLRKARQVTRVSDAAEISCVVHFVVMLTPGWENSRLSYQMDALKALDQVAIVDKPINRAVIMRAIQECYTDPVKPAAVVANSVTPGMLASKSAATKVGCGSPMTVPLSGAKETIDALVQLHSAAQLKLNQLNTLIQ